MMQLVQVMRIYQIYRPFLKEIIDKKLTALALHKKNNKNLVPTKTNR